MYRIFVMMAVMGLEPVMTSCDKVLVNEDNPVVTPPTPTTPDTPDTPIEVQITDISITGTGISAEGTVTLTVGTSLNLAVEITPKTTQSVKLVWKSSDETLLTISENGQLKAHKAGNCTVTVCPETYPEISASITVTIVDAEVDVDEDKADQSTAEARGCEH